VSVLSPLIIVLGHRLRELVSQILACTDPRELRRLSRRHREIEKLIKLFDPYQKKVSR
jgi:hypothetical protein